MKKLFIHIPKNAGMALRQTPGLASSVSFVNKQYHINAEYSRNLLLTMNKYGEHSGNGHARWRDIKPSITSKYAAFAIIRNPWSKVISRYAFALKTNTIAKDVTLEQFLEQRHEYGNLPFFWHRAIKGWYPQIDHVQDVDGNLQCDILRFEHLQEDIEKYLNLKTTLQFRNVSNGKAINKTSIVGRKDYQEFYNDTTYEIVADWYKKDIEFFGFTVDSTATKHIWNKS